LRVSHSRESLFTPVGFKFRVSKELTLDRHEPNLNWRDKF